MGDRAGRVALLEAERRVRSIALVHEILSRDPGDQVPFDEIVGSLVQMAEDSVVSSRADRDRGARGPRRGGAPTSPPRWPCAWPSCCRTRSSTPSIPRTPGAATGRPGREGAGRGGGRRAGAGTSTVTMVERRAGAGRVEVRDDGMGLPEGFDIERTTSLGLSIVRDLVVSQLDGSIAMEPVPVGRGGGTRVAIAVPVRAPGERPRP